MAASCELAVVTGKCDKVPLVSTSSLPNISLAEVESELYFLFHCPNYNHFKEPLLKYIWENEMLKLVSVGVNFQI